MERAERYVDAAALVCRRARALGVETTIIFLHSEAGPPVLNVENFRMVSDEFRLTSGIGEIIWRENVLFAMLREQVALIGSETVPLDALMPDARKRGYHGPSLCPLAIPLLGSSGWFGTLVHANSVPLPVELERQLLLHATELSVWCTARGIGRVPRVGGTADLPPRRHRIAQLAAQGLTNAEIAQTLVISINTVKSRLKQVFAQLCVDNRTELASVLRRLAPMRDVPLGVTRMDDVTVTRIEHPIGYSAPRARSATSCGCALVDGACCGRRSWRMDRTSHRSS